MADVLNIACGQLGVTESPAGSNRTKYGKWMGLDGQPWCMSFVQWCFHQAGTPLPHKTGSCSALLNWYKANRPACVVKDPQPRDIIIYNFGHTGILESAGTATVTAIEGNTSPGQSGSQENSGGVFRRTRSSRKTVQYPGGVSGLGAGYSAQAHPPRLPGRRHREAGRPGSARRSEPQ